MEYDLVSHAIQSVIGSSLAFCKFLTANDTGATGAHQSGVLISKSAAGMLFDEDLRNHEKLKRYINITWQNELVTQSCFTYYRSKNELRITRFGRGFPYLRSYQTGSLFVLTRQDSDDYSGFFLETENDIENFLNAFGISPTETNRLIHTNSSNILKEELEIQNFINSLQEEFPPSEQMAAAARMIQDKVYNHADYIQSNPDQKIIDWTTMEYTLFRALELARYGHTILQGFPSVDMFIDMANKVLNRRKSRAGKSLEHHLAAIFDGNQIRYSAQAITEGHKRPDFLFPSGEAYQDSNFPSEKLVSLAAKTTCKDRWRQIINEADRLRNRPKFLCTLQQGISSTQLEEMEQERVVLVVPKPYISAYPPVWRDRIWTLSKFISYVQELEDC